MIALLTGEALQMVDIAARAHHHLERWDHLVTRSAVSRVAEQPKQQNKH